MIRMYCFDFQRQLSDQTICDQSGLRPLRSLRIVTVTCLLHQLCTQTMHAPLTCETDATILHTGPGAQ